MKMEIKEKKQDQIYFQRKKPVWRRFIKIFPKSNLPWITVLIYLVIEFAAVNVTISQTDYMAQLLAGDISGRVIRMLFVTIIGALLISNFSVFFRSYTSARINRNMRQVMLKKVLSLPMSFFGEDNPQETIFRITDNSVVIDSTLTLFVIPVITALYQSGAVFLKISSYDTRLSLILLGFIPLQIFMAFLFGRLNYSVSEIESGLSARLVERLAEMVRNIPMAKAFSKEDEEEKRERKLTERLYKINIKSGWISQFNDLASTALDLIQVVLICVIGVIFIGKNAITLKTWIAFFLFSEIFNTAVQDFLTYWNNIKIIQGAAERLCDIMDAAEEDFDDGISCKNLSGDITFSDVRFSYTPDNEVLKGVNCTIKDGKVTALLGKSGCGKSTLIKLIQRLYEPDGGEICVAGQPVDAYSLTDFRSAFHVVPQNPMLFSGTIAENVSYGQENLSEDDIMNAIKKVGLESFVSGFEDGIYHPLDEMAESLSGGQRQRIALARAFLSDAHYLVFDEPISAMDACGSEEMLHLIRDCGKGRCVLVVAHSPKVLKYADDVVVIENGQISAFGNKDHVTEQNAFLSDIYPGGERDV